MGYVYINQEIFEKVIFILKMLSIHTSISQIFYIHTETMENDEKFRLHLITNICLD